MAARKLIETSLPLDAINAAGAREKSIRHGHPSTLHLWWARRPLAAARAVLFAQMVDDPDEERFPTEEARQAERERLFDILRRLVLWENTTNEEVLEEAREEIRKSWRRACEDNRDHPRAAELFDPERLPAFHDPFAGGGAIPLEAQRLGLEAHASDLNPVAVLINKALIEIPPKFAGKPPVNPEACSQPKLSQRSWKGATGLAEDIRHYGQWMRDEAEKRIGHLYPKVAVTTQMVEERPDLKRYAGRELTVIAWLWARTVRSPNPAFRDVEVPLASSFVLSAKKGKEAWVEPVVEGRSYRFRVRTGTPSDEAKRGTKSGGSGSSFLCLLSGVPMLFPYLRSEGKGGRLRSRLMAVVAAGDRERVYLSPNQEQVRASVAAKPDVLPETALPARALGFRVQEYGMLRWSDLFTDRQLVALTTFSDLVGEAMDRIRRDASIAGLRDDGIALRKGGVGALAYAEAVAVYLAFALSKQADLGNSLCRWEPLAQCPRQLFARQAIPMVWDFAEGNPLGYSSGSWTVCVEGIAKAFTRAFRVARTDAVGVARQMDAQSQGLSRGRVVSADPPYYDNIGYADLSDFFYVWLRRSLRSVCPELFATLSTPKADELIATPYRHGGTEEAETFFLEGMSTCLRRIAVDAHPMFPISVYYARKQSEQRGARGNRTGWETFLESVVRAGVSVHGTWPMRTENASRMTGQGTNALASSIVLVCRRRPDDAPTASRREFVTALRRKLPVSLRLLRSGNIAPVDLAQAAIGRGMAIYTRYAQVLDASGTPVPVRDALALIDQVRIEELTRAEGDFDKESRWALAWFDSHGFAEGPFGEAETLSTATNTSVATMARVGILESRGGSSPRGGGSRVPGTRGPARQRPPHRVGVPSIT